MKLKMQNAKVKIILSAFIFSLSLFIFSNSVFADTALDNGFSFLESKQDSAGRITTGFSAPSEWSAIAFSANGKDIASIKSSNASLLDFLLSDLPSTPASATDWETRILAIVDAGYDPTNFGGTNYVQELESFYNSGQLGDTCSLNDDIFGLLAEVAIGPAANTQIKQDTLNFLIAQEDATDGGYSYSAQGCSFYGTSADITGAAAVALMAAKNNGVTASNLDNAIASVSSYLSTNQDSDGGFGYFGTSDTDTTGWVLQGLNALGLGSSDKATNARNYLLSQQGSDGGIQAFDYGSNTLVSNATTTSQALIGLLGKTWLLKIYSPSQSTQVTVTPTLTITPTPTSQQGNSDTSVTPTLTPLVATPTPTSTPPTNENTFVSSPTVLPSPTQTVLGAATENNTPNTEPTKVAGATHSSWPFIFFLGGCFFMLVTLGKIGYNYFYSRKETL